MRTLVNKAVKRQNYKGNMEGYIQQVFLQKVCPGVNIYPAKKKGVNHLSSLESEVKSQCEWTQILIIIYSKWRCMQ